MARAKVPHPMDIESTLTVLNMMRYNGLSFRRATDLVRVYDRTTGNFKAVGWSMVLEYWAIGDSGYFVPPVERLKVVLFDEQLTEGVQTMLEEFGQ